MIEALTEVEDYGDWIEIEDGDGMVGVYEGTDLDLKGSIVEVFFGEDGFTRLLIPENNL
jgi:hypothetical protein